MYEMIKNLPEKIYKALETSVPELMTGCNYWLKHEYSIETDDDSIGEISGYFYIERLAENVIQFGEYVPGYDCWSTELQLEYTTIIFDNNLKAARVISEANVSGSYRIRFLDTESDLKYSSSIEVDVNITALAMLEKLLKQRVAGTWAYKPIPINTECSHKEFVAISIFD